MWRGAACWGGQQLSASCSAARPAADHTPHPLAMPSASPLNNRVVTGYQNIARKFFAKAGFEHVVLLSADGALEAAPAMGSADIILGEAGL